jgi:hypothetical protein
MKVLVILCAVFFGIFMIPVVFGLIGAMFGVVIGIFGAIFGIITGIFGAVFGGIFSIFDFDNHWHFGHNVNIFAVAAVALLIIVLSKSRRSHRS